MLVWLAVELRSGSVGRLLLLPLPLPLPLLLSHSRPLEAVAGRANDGESTIRGAGQCG